MGTRGGTNTQHRNEVLPYFSPTIANSSGDDIGMYNGLIVAVRGCSWLFVNVRGCSWLFVAVRGWSWLFVAVPCCSSLFVAVPPPLHYPAHPRPSDPVLSQIDGLRFDPTRLIPAASN